MVTEIKAYKTSDGQVLPSQSMAVHHELALLVMQAFKDNQTNAGMAQANAIVEALKQNDSEVVALLKQWRDCNPRPPVASSRAA